MLNHNTPALAVSDHFTPAAAIIGAGSDQRPITRRIDRHRTVTTGVMSLRVVSLRCHTSPIEGIPDFGSPLNSIVMSSRPKAAPRNLIHT